jgi:predicted ATPase
MRRKVDALPRRTGAPFLHRIASLPEKIDQTEYPFNVRAFSHGIDLALRSKVTFTREGGQGPGPVLHGSRPVRQADAQPTRVSEP